MEAITISRFCHLLSSNAAAAGTTVQTTGLNTLRGKTGGALFDTASPSAGRTGSRVSFDLEACRTCLSTGDRQGSGVSPAVAELRSSPAFDRPHLTCLR